MPPQSDYVAWVAPAVAIAGSGNKLLLWRGSEKSAQWSELVDFTRHGLRHVSRLALSPDHRWLAIVAEPAK
jgi:hypothetical protein